MLLVTIILMCASTALAYDPSTFLAGRPHMRYNIVHNVLNVTRLNECLSYNNTNLTLYYTDDDGQYFVIEPSSFGGLSEDSVWKCLGEQNASSGAFYGLSDALLDGSESVVSTGIKEGYLEWDSFNFYVDMGTSADRERRYSAPYGPNDGQHIGLVYSPQESRVFSSTMYKSATGGNYLNRKVRWYNPITVATQAVFFYPSSLASWNGFRPLPGKMRRPPCAGPANC